MILNGVIFISINYGVVYGASSYPSHSRVGSMKFRLTHMPEIRLLPQFIDGEHGIGICICVIIGRAPDTYYMGDHILYC